MVLLHALGTEGQRLFYTLPNTGDTFPASISALKEHFVPKELAATCDFGNMEEQLLRDQLIERVANTRIRDRILLELDLTFAKATTLALQIENGLRDANVLSDASAAGASAPVRGIQKQSKQSRSWDMTSRHRILFLPRFKLQVTAVPALAVDLPTTSLTTLHALLLK
ncbi:hypothetical protein CHARACLAT_031545 [Characodon lateralis]|uniref:Uncharacterized protein n=1 Tax=Characodon lateralis TaxID=208331 RepID=A0ABU7D2X5_9TELE|nr:hypothetical protein [Characodon lateralis]